MRVKTSQCGAHRLAVLAIVVIVLGLPAQPAAQAGPIANAWNQRTNVQSENPACAALIGRLRKHVVSLAQLRMAINKDLAGPAPSISGVVKNWLGEPYSSVSLKKKRDKFDAEMLETKELDTLGRTIGCEPFDIDEAMRLEAAKHPPPGAH